MILAVTGHDLGLLDHEAGGHRIQRVPPTERRGRVHTSTVTVAIMDQQVHDVGKIHVDDLDIGWFSGTGPGGQNRNKVMASCRLVHRPTGIVSTAQTRSRTNSFNQAMEQLCKRVTELQRCQSTLQDKVVRKGQIGSGQRGDKIRTIQFQNDSAVDHRSNKRITAAHYLKGYMDQLWSVDK